MSKGINKTISIGNLCADPEIKAMPNGTQVANIRLALNDSYKDKNTGDVVDNTEYVRVVFFGKVAEIVAQYLKKGSKIYVEGSLRTRKWQDKETGQDKYSTEIVGRELQMLDSKGGQNQSGQGSQNNQGFHPQQPQQMSGGSMAQGPDNFDDEFPF
jgi:single-strand DNA-binding protein